MKLSVMFVLLLSQQLYAQNMYVKSKVAKFFEANNATSKVLKELTLGSEVSLTSDKQNGLYREVNFQNQKGFIFSMQLSPEKPLDVVADASTLKVAKLDSARTRASAVENSAASARGLSAETRNRSDRDNFVEDNQAVAEMINYSLSIDANSVKAFAQSGNLY